MHSTDSCTVVFSRMLTIVQDAGNAVLGQKVGMPFTIDSGTVDLSMGRIVGQDSLDAVLMPKVSMSTASAGAESCTAQCSSLTREKPRPDDLLCICSSSCSCHLGRPQAAVQIMA